MFGEDEVDNHDESNIDKFCNYTFIQLMKIRPHLKRSIDPHTDLILPRSVGIVYTQSDLNRDFDDAIFDSLQKKMKLAKFEIIDIIKLPDPESLSSKGDQIRNLIHSGETAAENQMKDLLKFSSTTSFQYDVLIVNDLDNVNAIHIFSYALIPGGQLFSFKYSDSVAATDDQCNVLTSESHQVLNQLFSPLSDDFTNSSGFRRLQRKYIDSNLIATPYWSPLLQVEDATLKHVTLCLSVLERKKQIFSDSTLEKAIDILRTYGVVIFKGLYRKESVRKWGDAATQDMISVILKLRERGIELWKDKETEKNTIDKKSSTKKTSLANDTFTIKSNIQDKNLVTSMIENYHEMSMREAHRCDLRNGYEMKKIANLADSQYNSNSPLNESSISSSISIDNIDVDIRHHQGVIDVLAQVANISGGEVSKGNWGRWNFEGAGPDGPPPPLTIGQVGCVMSLPGCCDQTIHADTSHIYTHTQLPGHYYNLFLPALSEESCNNTNYVGQTAFVCKSHILQTAYDVMVSELGENYLNNLLIRPQLHAGDGLIFDCRILHLGLANRYHEIKHTNKQQQQSLSQICNNSYSNNNDDVNVLDTKGWRPMLYINYHQPWFIDPKNWNNNEKLFP